MSSDPEKGVRISMTNHDCSEEEGAGGEADD